MPKLRTPPDHGLDTAIEQLESLTANNHRLEAQRSGPDQVKLAVGRDEWPARVLVRDAVSGRDARMLIQSEPRGSKIIVANQLSEEAKDVLTEHNESLRVHGWSWLDRRGELQLNSPKAAGTLLFEGRRPGGRDGLASNVKLAAPSSDGPIRGRAGISCASALLLNPDDPPSIRSIARDAQMSHGGIGEASKLLRDVGLVLPDGRPHLPDLFWSLAAVWSPTRVTPVNELPTAQLADRLRANIDGPLVDATPGWCVGGDEAALVWGAPLFTAASRPWIWVPTEADARRTERALGTGSWDDSAAVVGVPPTALVTLHRVWPASEDLPLRFLPTAHPLFLALDLAQDPGRGREMLDDWHPDDPRIQRVW